jgi:hypothetical protein
MSRRVTRLTAFIPWLFSALIALSSAQMAVARHAAVPVGTAVICSGHLTSVILVDANGQRTEAAHLCPDCLAFSAVLPDGTAAPGHLAATMPIWLSIDAVPSGAETPIFQRARGPPVPI